jgi:threonine dehydrogenase-like Zn-dependent dehydrogenase
MTTIAPIPAKQAAVQLVGPDKLALNTDKPVPKPGPRQILGRVEAVGLCFSDLKLLKQFHEHVRKGPVVRGINQEILAALPSYAPGDKPTVPGHEVVITIVAVGEGVTTAKVGERVLVQPDWRQLRTPASNGAMGYNFEGGLQEYVLLDERIITGDGDDRFLMPVADHLGASQVALVEPWACVEDSYVTRERRTLKAGGRLLLAAEGAFPQAALDAFLATQPKPATISCWSASGAACACNGTKVADLSTLAPESFDDIIYFGASKATVEKLNGLLAAEAIINIVQGGARFGAPVSVGVGRVHYGYTRWVGSPDGDIAAGYRNIPETGEVRAGDNVLVVGAGGPMGQMHVIRDLCTGLPGVSVIAADVDDGRLDALKRKAAGIAQRLGVELKLVNTTREPLGNAYSYIALMAPIGALVADSIVRGTRGTIINIFAGIPAPVCQELDLDRYIAHGMFMFGTSGSTIEDMRILLGKVTDGRLNTNTSVDAVSGMAGAIDGIRAVEHRTMPGKIIVYPMLRDVPLIPLTELHKHYPTVASLLEDGQWCPAAEREFLRVAAG